MTKNFPLLQLTLVLGLGLATSGCEAVSNAADSVGNAVTGVADGIGSAVSDVADGVGNVASDINPFSDGSDSVETASADAPPSADSAANTTPDLANLPSRPSTSTPAQQQAAAQSLAADGAQARYSADALRAGTEASAAPPAAADLPPSARAANDLPPTTDTAPSAAPSAALAQGTGAVPTAAAPARVQTASVAPSRPAMPPGAEPAVPANTPVRGAGMAMGSQIASDASLGFRPYAAPPLDASINQWVSAPVVARYRQTASNAGISATSLAAVPARGAAADSGAVIANLDAVSMGPSAMAAMNGGVPATAVVYFPGDGTSLSAAARTQIRSAVAQFKATGGAASVRVVGHASSRTPNMSIQKHLETIFDKSQARANAVAQELIREGVPAAKVLVDAVGDSQPVYYESMPQGEDGNRRAEIFVQG